MKIFMVSFASFCFFSNFTARAALADLSITFGGDVNFNKNKQAPMADGADVFGRKVRFEDTTVGIRNLLDGDLNFANIETVVTEDKSVAAESKIFVFRSHPNALRHLLEIGFNIFSLANNHSANHGFIGLRETLDAMNELVKEGRRFAFAGIERTREDFAKARIFEVNGHTIAVAAVAITDPTFRAGKDRPGVLNYRDDSDYDLALRSLREANADLKILSLHAGIEMKTTTEADQRVRFERALKEGDVDLVLGTHPHVVRPVAAIDGRAIFYSLGNYLMLGAADIGAKGLGLDYGLFGKAHFAWDSLAKKLKLQAIEVIPLTQMHLNPKPMAAKAAAERITYLNKLSVNDLGSAKAVQFKIRVDGSGTACFRQGLPYSARAAVVCD